MAGKSSTFDNQFLQLIFNAVAITGLATNATSSPLTTLWVSLHTADPTATGNQSTSEATYTSYARVGVARTSGGWVITGSSVSPVSNIVFPQATGGSSTITNFSVGTAQTGTGQILYTGSVSPTITVTTGITPQLTTLTSITEA